MMSFYPKTFELLKELRSHAIWEGVKETFLNAGVICGALVTALQWLRHHYGWLFIVSVCLSAVSFGGIGISIGRKLKHRDSSIGTRRQTETSEKPTLPSASSDRHVIESATLEDIKKYDPKYRRILAASGATACFVVCLIGVAAVTAVFRADDEGSISPSVATANSLPSSVEHPVVATSVSDPANQRVLVDPKSHKYYCDLSQWPQSAGRHADIVVQREAVLAGNRPITRTCGIEAWETQQILDKLRQQRALTESPHK